MQHTRDSSLSSHDTFGPIFIARSSLNIFFDTLTDMKMASVDNQHTVATDVQVL